MNSISATGAAVFRAMEEETLISKSLQVAAHGAYYRISAEEGNAQFKYWISQNKHEVTKMLTFFNLDNNNIIGKEGQKILFDSIQTNQVLYVPMITKIYDM